MTTAMTLARSARPYRLLAAAALLVALAAPAAVSAAGGNGHHNGRIWLGNGGHGRQRGAGSQVRPHLVSGIVTSIGGATAPTTLTVQTVGGLTINVTVPASTTVVRRYGGPSGLDEMVAGDRVSVWGSFEPGSSTFDAVRIKDWSIQRVDSRVVGLVQSAANNGAVVLVGRHEHGRRNPYYHGETVQVTFTASTVVMSGSMTVTVAAVQPGLRIVAMGTYDRIGHTLTATRVRILSAHARGNEGQTGAATPEAEATQQAGDATATPAPTGTTTTDATATATSDDATATATPTDTITSDATATPAPGA